MSPLPQFPVAFQARPQFFAAFLVLLLPRLSPQAATVSPDNPEILQLQETSRMLETMHYQMKTLRRSLGQLTEVKAVASRLNDLLAHQEELAARQNETAVVLKELAGRQNETAAALKELAARQNETAAVVEELAARQNETIARQDERFAEFCRTRKMGMSTGTIPDSSITATSVYDNRFLAKMGRVGTNRKGWLARSLNMDAEWMKVDLGQESRVYGVVTQGRPDYNQWARTYKLSFSQDGQTWTTYANLDGSDKVFAGNYDRSSPVYNFLERPVTVRYVRFHPRTYTSRPVMRVEILGCPTDML
ncbi:PREDICTED: inactive carboxypeptidase-like protein X2 [Branchiostoma belcheri]|uniref:Inactive carboxypeptidase-like protein X2 n=1 Tax=Branchiostoma belcheri TaxID=7741 RepID=A0A6P4ZF24_BRABE|nr:PREDICTED: inactive carboxypeptidase-like protein X2 [Branchiostoma belcheri]